MAEANFEETSYNLTGDFFGSLYGSLLLQSFIKAMRLDHKLPEAISGMMGMSGRKYRYLINNLIYVLPGARYLEVGSWLGSTACSAIFGNILRLTCVDNWSQFEGPKDTFLSNVKAVSNKNTVFSFIEGDFRSVDYKSIGSFNVYMFDGPHDENDQYDGIVIALPALDDMFILVVDDWNLDRVRDGTRSAIKDCNINIECAIEIRTTQNNIQPTKNKFQDSEWHNGYYIASCNKKAPRDI